MSVGRRASLLAPVLLAGCVVDVNYGDTEFLCSDGQTCPAGKECIDFVCRDPGFQRDAAPPDAPEIDLTPVIGDVLTYTFDTIDDGELLVIDSSGNQFHGLDLAEIAEGRFGGGLGFDAGAVNAQHLFVATQGALSTGNTITIEAWVFRDTGDVASALFGDLRPVGIPPVTYQLEIDATNHLVFTTNPGCSDAPIAVTGAAAEVATGQWVHAALAWDGTTARFYIDGVETDAEPLAAEPCSALSDHWMAGARDDGTNRLDGRIDELKISSYAKTAAEIAASMDFDSTGLIDACGNGVLTGGQQCELGGLCCSNSCSALADGQACEAGSGDTCSAGACDVAGGRISGGLVALYLFDEGAGTVVADSSGAGAPVNLTIANEALVTWRSSALEITQPVAITSVTPATKISSAGRAANAVSFEAWVTPANLTQNGPARIATLSLDTSARNLLLGQEGASYAGRVRSTSTDNNGNPHALAAATASVGLTHVAVTVGLSGTRRVYVDGALAGVTRSSGAFSNWSDAMILSVGDEVGGSRPWLGAIHLLAIYGRELSPVEVAQSFQAGPD